MDHPRPWLKYVDADDIESSTIAFDGMNVDSPSAEKLGTVDGFIVDSASGRPFYLVVDAGGWFKSKLFLLPIGHVAFASDRKHFVADISRERVQGFPGFDRDEFEKLSDEELSRMDEQIVASCCPGQTIDRSAWRFEQWTHYKSPSWWDASFYRPDRVDAAMHDMGTTMPSRDDVRARHDASSQPSMAHDKKR
jgi:hypothetical protein